MTTVPSNLPRIQRTAVVGAGAMGGYLGGMLAHAGQDVSFVARGVNLAAIQAQGISIQIDATDPFTVPVAATDEPDSIGPVDLIIVGVKTYDLDSATEQVRPLVGPETMILTIQNGIDAASRVSATLGVSRVLAAALFFATRRTDLGVIQKLAGPGGRLLLGDPEGGLSPHVESVAAALRDAGFDVQLPADIRVALWEKFLAISSRGTLSALTRLPGGPLVACPETMHLLSGLVAEGAEVANASGIPLTEDTVAHIVDLVQHFPPQVRSSQYDDLVAGRRLELEALNGTIVRLGQAHGIATPLNFAVYAALKPYVNGASDVGADHPTSAALT